MSKSHDISQPIVFVLRRGRNGRGYLVAPLDKMDDPAPCASAQDIGEVAVELLDDPTQPRFDASQKTYSEDDHRNSETDEDWDGEEGEEDEEDEGQEDEGSQKSRRGSIFDGVDSSSGVPIEDQLLTNLGMGIFNWAKSTSDRRTAAVRSRKKKGR